MNNSTVLRFNRKSEALGLLCYVTALFLPIFFSFGRAIAQDIVAGRASVVDGDSIEIHGIPIRLHGIDAPESSQWCSRDNIAYRCGREAAFALMDKIGLKTVNCIRRDTDRYGRLVGACTAGGEDLNAWLVSQGYAIAYRRYSSDYIATEDMAREAKRGLWAGEFEKPEDFRRAGRERPQQPPLARHACICPGDVDSAGRRCGQRSAYTRSGGLAPACAGRT
jgi:endonuclease YncB( thermonuclease family)